jgi:hypothetical protein
MNKVKIKDIAPQLMSKAEQAKQIRPRRIAWLVAAALGLTLARPSVAPGTLVLSNAQSGYHVNGLFGTEIGGMAAPITAHFDGQTMIGQSVVHIGTSFGNRPMAEVQVHSSWTFGTWAEVYTYGYASVDYQVGINQLGPIPVINPPIWVPVRVTVRGHASSDVGGNAHAHVGIPGAAFDTPPNFDETITVSMAIGAPHNVSVYVIGVATASQQLPTSEAQAVAVVGPFFEFDQDAFDAQRAEQGLPTFTLADYYEFQFSPNMLAGDLDDDGDVDFVDFSILAHQWRQAPGEPSADIAPPEEPDDIVDFLDLGVFCAYWLEGTNP